LAPSPSVKGAEGSSVNVKGSGKQSGGGRKPTGGAVKIAKPQPIAPAGLVPVGAPVPMMLMSTTVPQLGSFTGPAAVPFMGPNGQIIHQQLISTSSVPAHQMIPVFQQQQQQNAAPQFAVSQPVAPNSAPETTDRDSQKTQLDDENGLVDSGIENEPPPLLVQEFILKVISTETGETKDALDVHMLFIREAERYYQKAGKKGKIVHIIEGFEIEESDEPFPCEPPIRLSDWITSEAELKEGTPDEEEEQKEVAAEAVAAAAAPLPPPPQSPQPPPPPPPPQPDSCMSKFKS
uniref:SURP motif domain-containing protein n=1 Tax=Gongylonema pulchrum TaxID=637853 RepID=A0A183E441_9BILA